MDEEKKPTEETEEETEDKIEEEAKEDAEKFMSNVQKMIEATIQNMQGQKEEIKSTTEMTKESTEKMDKDEKIAEFFKALINNDKQKLQVLSEGTPGNGGYLVPVELYGQIVEELRDVAVIRSRATVIDPCPKELDINTLASRPKVYWRGEAAVKSTSTATFTQASLTPYSLAVIVVLTKELISDAVIPASITSYITKLISTAIGEEEDKVFAAGNGSSKPTGIDAYNATVPRSVTTAANIVDTDSLISAVYKLGSMYRKNAIWLMNSLTLTKVMQLKDGQNRNIFLADATGPMAGTLLGKQVFEQNDLPQSRIWFGDLKGYWIGVREGISVMQSEEATIAGYSLFERNEVAIRVEERIDGEMADPHAFVVINGTN
jgi:HK97 family phage major capsid protein